LCEGTQPQCFEKEFYQRLGDICIGSIENTEFWVDKRFIRILETFALYLDVIDALGRRVFFGNAEKDFQN
jgi:uncharacterized protein (DUF779 family)